MNKQLVAALAAAGMFVVSVPATAQTVSVDRVARGAPGSEQLLVSEPVDKNDVGQLCEVTLTGGNGPSVHLGNDLVLRSGGGSVVLPDFEQTSGEVSSVTGQLTLGTTLDVYVQFGPDGVTSTGVTVETDCTPPPTVTTSSTSTTSSSTTTTVPPDAPPTTPRFAG